MCFKLKSRTQPDSFVLYGDLYDSNGSPVMAALRVNLSARTPLVESVNKVTSAYSRTNTQSLLDKSDILYVNPDTERTAGWLQGIGLQLPSRVAQGGSSDVNIPNSVGKVNSKFSDRNKNNTGTAGAEMLTSSGETPPSDLTPKANPEVTRVDSTASVQQPEPKVNPESATAPNAAPADDAAAAAARAEKRAMKRQAKQDESYRTFIENPDYGEPKGITPVAYFAKMLTGKGVKFSKDLARNLDAAAARVPHLRAVLRNTIENPLSKAKGLYSSAVKKKLDFLFNDIVKALDIKKGSSESAAVQWLGEGRRQAFNEKGKVISGEFSDYTPQNLKEDFNYTAANGKKAWENIVKAESIIRRTYNEYVDEINDVLRKIYPNVEDEVARLRKKLADATDPAEIEKLEQAIDDAWVGKRLVPRKDYFRHFTELQQDGFFKTVDSVLNGATAIDPRLVGVSEFTQPKTKYSSLLQHRNLGAYTEDAIGGMLDYIPQAEYKKHIEPMIPILRSVVKDLKENTIDTKNANQLIGYLMKFTDDLAGKTLPADRAVQSIFGDEAGRRALNVLGRFSNRVRSGLVVGNINTMLAQLYNMPNLVALAKNPVDIGAGMIEATKAAFGDKSARDILAKSDFLRERYLDRSFRRFSTDKTRFAQEVLARSLELGDKAVADSAFLTFYRQALKDGLDDAAAILRADDLTRRAVAGRGIGEMPLHQKAKIVKILAPFQVEVQNSWNLVKELADVRGKKPTEALKDIGGLMAMLGTYHIMNEGLEALTGRRIGFDPIHYLREYMEGEYEDEDHPLPTAGANMLGNVVSNVPFGSYAATAFQGAAGMTDSDMAKLFGEDDPSRFGVGGALLETVAEPIGQAVSGQNVNLLKPALTIGMPYGGRQLERSIRGLQDMGKIPRLNINKNEGISLDRQDFPASYTSRGNLRFPVEDTPVNFAKSLAFGPFSTREGKEYLESNSRPLTAGQTSKVEEAYRQQYRGKNEEYALTQATVDALRNRSSADKDGSGGVSNAELAAYIKGIAKKYNLSPARERYLYRLMTAKSSEES